jgi:hypothetical protein
MASFSLTSASELFKTTYGKLSDNVYNSSNVVLGRVKKSYDFVGKRKEVAVPMSFQGGVGSGSIPIANPAAYADAIITAKKVYGVCEIDREAIKAAMIDEGSFVRGTKHSVEKTVESYMRNMSRMLFNSLVNGSVGTINAGGVTDNGGGNYTLIVSSATWKEANFEEGDYINIETANTDLFEVQAVVPATRAVTVQRITGSQVPVATDVMFMQGSENNDITGIMTVLAATTGSLYGIPVARRWKAGHQKDAGGSGITPDKLNEAVLAIQRSSGKVPNLIVASFTQYRKILNFLEDAKEYTIEPRSAELQGKISFKGIEYMSSAGAIPIFVERFVDEDKIVFLNDSMMEIYHRPGQGWMDDDGTVFLRTTGDSYGARYGGYFEFYMPPPFHGYIYNLAV